MSDDLFARTARQHRLQAPGLLASQEEWESYCRKVWSHFPAWGYDNAFVTEAARPFLPRVLEQMNIGRMLGWVSDDPVDALVAGIELPEWPEDWSWRWMVEHAAVPSTIPLRASAHAEGMVFQLERSPAAPLLFLCANRHDWRCPRLSRQGDDLIDLGAWRWNVGQAKAAYRIARLSGLRRAVP